MAAKKKPPPAKKAKAKATAKAKASAPRLADVWTNLSSRDELRVWADMLSDQGDPRGEFIQLSNVDDPTDEQSDALSAVQEKHGGKLVGPAREYLRTWVFDEYGLVSCATCEADRFIAGFDVIVDLHPRLWVCITSLRKKTAATIAALAKLPLEKAYYLSLSNNGLSDKSLAALAPALKHVRHLGLAHNDLTAAGLVALGEHVEKLELLELGVHMRDGGGQPLANSMAEALTSIPAYRTLRAVVFDSRYPPDAAHIAALQKLPNMTKIAVNKRVELGFDEIETLKRR